MDARTFRQQAAIQLMAAWIIEDRIAWFKDPSCFGADLETLAGCAVDAADALATALAKRDPQFALAQQDEEMSNASLAMIARQTGETPP